ncbi:MAG TPA: endonuclease/exonuclease/phosphatase family protein [Actinomycetota bacterium]|nr:endonuclease/exonuclease/phosphatase family protein [Actinomycetota bacterium]
MTERVLRVATWNVHGLRAGVPAAASAIRAEEPDVLLLQESGPRRRLRDLGRALGWTVSADPRVFPRRRVQNALLARPGAAELIRPRLVRFARGSPWHPRGALIAEVDERWTAVSAHLGLDRRERERHVAELGSLFEGATRPLVLGADLNARPDDPVSRSLAAQLTDVWGQVGEDDGATFPATEPTARIDYLFVGPAFQALRAWTAGSTASDHLMVVADLAFD